MGTGSVWYIFTVRLKAYPDTTLKEDAGQRFHANVRPKYRSFSFPRSQKSRDLGTPAKADSSPLKQFGMTRSKEFSGIQIRDVQGTLKAHPDTNLGEDA